MVTPAALGNSRPETAGCTLSRMERSTPVTPSPLAFARDEPHGAFAGLVDGDHVAV